MLEEAFRRARQNPFNAHLDSDTLLSAIIAEARRGTRDMYGLVSAAAKAGSARPEEPTALVTRLFVSAIGG
jgi:hypothetical protein